ncbi:MAG: AraC family transcriptional regulator [Pseudomonadota bacterium]
MIQDMISEVSSVVEGRRDNGPAHMLDVPRLAVVHDPAPTQLEAHLYRPILCIVLQGKKELWIGERKVVMQPVQALVVSHDVPVSTRIFQATPDKPYVALVIELNLAMARSLVGEISDAMPSSSAARSVTAGRADDGLLDAMRRLLALHATPADAVVMEPLIRREIHYRLLMADHGGMLRELLRLDSQAGRIAKAIRHIQADHTAALSVADLASLAGMSPSTFHEHFKAVTGTTPLQYQKDMRLLEAKRLLQEGGRSVSSIAFDVGYESPTQFSREYSRKFGASPRQHLRTLVDA